MARRSSLDLLQQLLVQAAEMPLKLVMTGRPAPPTRRPGWATDEAIVRLLPLAAGQGDELVQTLLQRVHPVPAQLSNLVVGRAKGNPHCMEALVRRLIDDGVIVASAPRWTAPRWFCQQALSAAADARAVPLLMQLHADVQARAVELTHAADRLRLVQSLPAFRDVVAAYRRHGEAGTDVARCGWTASE